jgi:endonuclease/exonuclease/phosphatase family metal-dependent hydrolase
MHYRPAALASEIARSMPRILTYNVHRFVGTDRKTSPGRTAEVIAACEADVVALQEVRVGRSRRDGVDLEAVARYLGMDLHFEPTIRLFGEQFGLAVLTALPTRRIKAGALPTLPNRRSLEARKALWVGVEAGGCELQIVNTHLSLLSRRERLLQADALLGEEWLAGRACANPVVVVGDLNAGSGSKAYGRLAEELRDVQLEATLPRLQPTFHTRLPLRRIDHIFVSPSIDVLHAEARRTPLARLASDHLPLIANLRLPGEARVPATPVAAAELVAA